MPWTQEHLSWLHQTGEVIVAASGESVPVFEFAYDMTDNSVMSLWAAHFRNHYSLDSDTSVLKPAGMSKAEYLINLKFPDKTVSPGPSIRAGDFAEILVADYLQFLRLYYVPRTRYDRKIIGNESSKGSDVIGFRKSGNLSNRNDELIVYEVKARLSENSVANVLQSAVNDSSKDETRLAESLNGIKQRLYDQRNLEGFEIVSRFQRNVDEPYIMKYGAAAVTANSSYCSETLSECDTSEHTSSDSLEMIVIRGPNLMSLVHELYRRAADEA